MEKRHESQAVLLTQALLAGAKIFQAPRVASKALFYLSCDEMFTDSVTNANSFLTACAYTGNHKSTAYQSSLKTSLLDPQSDSSQYTRKGV